MQWVVVSGVFVFAAAVQGLTGAGYALVAAPILLIAAPAMVPVPLLLVELILMVAMVLRERYAIDFRILAGALVASFPGAAVGVAILARCPPRVVAILISTAITVLAALTLKGLAIPMTRWSMVGAGFSAGAMNSIAGMPGPPIALVYRPRDAATLRTNLSLSFLIMSIFSLAMLYAEGIGTADSLRSAALYLPAVLVGFVVARVFVHQVSSYVITQAVLWLTLMAGVSLFGRTILS